MSRIKTRDALISALGGTWGDYTGMTLEQVAELARCELVRYRRLAEWQADELSRGREALVYALERHGREVPRHAALTDLVAEVTALTSAPRALETVQRESGNGPATEGS